ncbi:di-trans,poly-cis-decaprenylcistransferase [Candidatus Falkowbacteria bacterium RIFOXYB2_FULL_47_14]|uniref:Isoprenyl transferase n=1 Tax=Candidatus Falkowbacteria bacterium RIFOXYA2_FULL_47_19 TaxID=1797994 RepID=A0A1F5SNB0_9BACT|nr:MAG: di-trans,poly-cis-decaprenylcistransferase [Candidatus Falkowbacteria bacterium RIFOXYA2_FULL_47_19]OGF36035.1 MAG: di-trans,poly-cis-decaprenylcistransferase [Candidatus Falkowbacteria bacterium RIFOXYC2_FULL_46_15]OGF43425.1 MAG: di-trans,poly-cis-decaprenylcistransferase [Candidatus Falkowbacteria bacterium RIFOXYB2_FULL_47_14]
MDTNKDNKKNVAGHIAIIMDGNRRWARERNLSTLEGHLKGYNKMKSVPEWFFSRGVEIISLFAFSTENWNRGRDEVNYLMKLLRRALKDDFEEYNQREYRLIVSGRIDELPGDLPEVCADAMIKTKDNSKGTLNICLNYGGRAEIIDAIRKMIKNKIEIEQVHEGMLRKYLYHGDLPDPDMIVRTSGEYRLSGFQLWQSAYSELMFLKKYWPEFEKADVDIILEEYANRKRRFGGDEKS